MVKGRLKGGVRALAGVLVALSLGAGSAHAQVPDPLAPGPYGFKKVEYNAGNLMITIPPANGTASQTFPQPLEGSIVYPDTPGPWKVLRVPARPPLDVHHRRRRRELAADQPLPIATCRDTDNPDGTENTTNIRSYQGYDYLSTNLASHGYVVMSISANTVVSYDNTFSYDAGANARSQIIAASLDLLYRWNNGTGPVIAGDDYHTVGEKLTGKMEMQRVGLMGHSRGGEGVTDFIRFNRQRPSGGRIYNLQAVMSLAPIDSQKQVPLGTNFGVILPACDGDVSTLAGANAYERSKYPNTADAFAKVQWYVQGANHNYFNTVWTNDDGASYSDRRRRPRRRMRRGPAELDPALPVRPAQGRPRPDGGLPAQLPRHGVAVRAADDGRGRLPGQRVSRAARRRLPRAIQDELRGARRHAPGRDPARGVEPARVECGGRRADRNRFRDLRLVQRGPRPALGRADQAVPAERRRDLDGLHQPLLRAPAHARLGRPGDTARATGRRGARRDAVRDAEPAHGGQLRRRAQPGLQRDEPGERDRRTSTSC